jgi:hypothetical protein
VGTVRPAGTIYEGIGYRLKSALPELVEVGSAAREARHHLIDRLASE